MDLIWIFVAIGMSFLITFLLGKWLIPYLHKLKFGQTILKEGPSWHENKQGTPTMGGVMFIIGIVISTIICVLSFYLFASKYVFNVTESSVMTSKIFAGLGMAVCFGAIGLADDYIKVVKKRNLGLTARQKLILQFSTVAIYFIVIYIIKFMNGATDFTSTLIPFMGKIDLGIFYWPIASVLIVGVVNAVNLTDGIDGLDASVTFFAANFMMIIAVFLNAIGIGIMSAALVGGCLGFLLWNLYPAKVFMGDTGSLFLGGLISAILFGLDLPILIIPIGLVYIIEMFSVILQVFYFKMTHGKRLFKMSPIHHHFEMSGWSEIKICFVFSLIMIIMGIFSLWTVVYGI